MSDALLLWPLAYLLHSTLLLGVAWLASRRVRPAALRETLWRVAFFGAFVTASLQPLAQFVASHTMSTASAVAGSGPAGARPLSFPATPVAAAPIAPVAPIAPTPAPATAAAPIEGRWWLPSETRLALLATLLAWAVVAVGGLALLALQWAWLRRACRRLRANDDEGWARSARELARHYGLSRTPALKVGAPWASPLVGPRGEVCLPDWCLAQMQGAQRDAVLAHELAHVARRDPAWRVAARAAACLGWMQPLNLVALRHLDALAEQACDAHAARAIADRHAVAEALYRCAEQSHAGRRAPRLNPGMAAARSPLMRRIEALVRRDPDLPARPSTRRWWAVLAVLVAGGACLLPALRLKGAEWRGAQWHDVVVDLLPSLGQRTHVMTRSPGGDFDLWIRGDATLRDDRDELKSGHATIVETTGGVTRRLEIDPDTGGPATRRYLVDGHVHALDAEGLQWAARRWDTLVATLLNPAQRIDRLMQRGGPEAVMQAIERPVDIGSQHELIAAWAGSRTLDDETVRRLVAAADRAEPAGDDYDRLLSLRDIATRQRLTPDEKARFAAAVAARAANGESAGALQALIQQLDAATPAQTLALAAAALRGLPSDYARRDVLNHALDKGSDTAVDLALQVSTAFESEFDRRDLLEHVARRLATLDDAGRVARFAASAHQLHAAYERRAALLALVQAVPLDAPGCMAVLDALEGMDSTSDLTPVLLAVARRMPADTALLARYRQLARVLPAFERGQAEQALDALPQA